MACRSYLFRNEPQQIGGQPPVVSVAYMMPPSRCGLKDLFISIINCMKYRAVKGDISSLRRRVMDKLKECKVEILIIDEADRLRPETFPEVRDISDNLGIAVVLIGTTERLDAVLKRDEQVYERFLAHQRFGKLGGEEFEETLMIWEKKVIALPVPSNLNQTDTKALLLTTTKGYIGRLDGILRESAIRSVSKGHKRIEYSILKEVAREYS
jgi:DNA transposition AAA+ family ATPase